MPLTPQLAKATFNQDLHAAAGNDFSIFGDILQIVQPAAILETGFFKGGSACLLLYLSGSANLTSIDPMRDPGGATHQGDIGNVAVLQSLFPGRFTFLHKSSAHVRNDLAGQHFDLFNIDGDHTEAGITNDLQLAASLSIPWIILDDFNGPVVEVYQKQFAADYFPVKIYRRDDHHQGQPILRVLMRRREPSLVAVPHGLAVRVVS